MHWNNFAWGWCFAIKRRVLRESNLLRRWGRAFCDDTVLIIPVQKLGLRVAFVPSLMMINRENTSLGEFYRWVCRQMINVRLYHPPWPNAWSWLGAALQATTATFGTVCAPGQRYHPSIVAQAAATLAQMYPERFWLAVGTGQNLNEHITGDEWPSKEKRQQRLHECVSIIRQLWNGDTGATSSRPQAYRLDELNGPAAHGADRRRGTECDGE